MRQVAKAALNAFKIEGRFELLRQAGNSLYRVYAAPGELTSSLFEPGQYLLRVHEPGYQTTEALELELAWLSAMRREGNRGPQARETCCLE